MKREELIALLKEAVVREESATSIYMKHLSAIVSRSGLPAEEIAGIRKTLQQLIEGNEAHKAYLISLIERIRAEERDVL